MKVEYNDLEGKIEQLFIMVLDRTLYPEEAVGKLLELLSDSVSQDITLTGIDGFSRCANETKEDFGMLQGLTGELYEAFARRVFIKYISNINGE